MNSAEPKMLLLIESAGHGGAERVVLNLAQELKRNSVAVDVLTFRNGWLTDSLDAAQIPRFLLPPQRRFDFGLPFRLAQFIKRGRYNLLHSHLLDSNFYGALAARLAGIPHVATEHGDVHHTEKKRFSRTKLLTIGLARSVVTTVSQFTASALGKAGISRGRIHVLPNPVEFSEPPADARVKIRTSLGIQNEWLWLNVANLRPVKDQTNLIRAFAQSASSTEQVLCIAGGGSEENNLRKLAAELGVERRVYFLGFRNDIPELLAAADGFVLSSRSEAMPVALLEAAGAGRIVVSTAVGGIPEIIDAKSGYLVPPGDPRALGAALVNVLKNPAEAQARAKNCLENVRKRFSVSVATKAYLDLYGSLRSDTFGSARGTR